MTTKVSTLHPRYGVVRDEGRWFVFDTESPRKYRFPVPYTNHELAECVADRYNAVEDGADADALDRMRGVADSIRGLK